MLPDLPHLIVKIFLWRRVVVVFLPFTSSVSPESHHLPSRHFNHFSSRHNSSRATAVLSSISLSLALRTPLSPHPPHPSFPGDALPPSTSLLKLRWVSVSRVLLYPVAVTVRSPLTNHVKGRLSFVGRDKAPTYGCRVPRCSAVPGSLYI